MGWDTIVSRNRPDHFIYSPLWQTSPTQQRYTATNSEAAPLVSPERVQSLSGALGRLCHGHVVSFESSTENNVMFKMPWKR